MRRMASVLLLFLLCLSLPVLAQSYGIACGDIYLSALQGSYERDLYEVAAFENFNWYLVVELDFADCGYPEQQPANGIKGWECGVGVPEVITVLNRTLLPETSLNIGQDDNWIIGTGQNVRAVETPYVVVQYTGLLLSPQIDLHLTIYGSDPSSFVPAVPGWVEFTATGECTFADGSPKPCLREFANSNVGKGGFWVNRTIIGVDETSWGSVKARF